MKTARLTIKKRGAFEHLAFAFLELFLDVFANSGGKVICRDVVKFCKRGGGFGDVKGIFDGEDVEMLG